MSQMQKVILKRRKNSEEEESELVRRNTNYVEDERNEIEDDLKPDESEETKEEEKDIYLTKLQELIQMSSHPNTPASIRKPTRSSPSGSRISSRNPSMEKEKRGPPIEKLKQSLTEELDKASFGEFDISKSSGIGIDPDQLARALSDLESQDESESLKSSSSNSSISPREISGQSSSSPKSETNSKMLQRRMSWGSNVTDPQSKKLIPPGLVKPPTISEPSNNHGVSVTTSPSTPKLQNIKPNPSLLISSSPKESTELRNSNGIMKKASSLINIPPLPQQTPPEFDDNSNKARRSIKKKKGTIVEEIEISSPLPQVVTGRPKSNSISYGSSFSLSIDPKDFSQKETVKLLELLQTQVYKEVSKLNQKLLEEKKLRHAFEKENQMLREHLQQLQSNYDNLKKEICNNSREAEKGDLNLFEIDSTIEKIKIQLQEIK